MFKPKAFSALDSRARCDWIIPKSTALTAPKLLIGGSLPCGPTNSLQRGMHHCRAVSRDQHFVPKRVRVLSGSNTSFVGPFAPQCLTSSFNLALTANFGNRPLFETQPPAQLQRQPRLRLGHRTDSIRPNDRSGRYQASRCSTSSACWVWLSPGGWWGMQR